MTKLTRQEFDSCLYHKPDPAPIKAAAQKHEYRKFWCLWVPLGAGVAFVLTLIAGQAGVFFPAWFVCSMLLWGCGEGLGEKNEPNS